MTVCVRGCSADGDVVERGVGGGRSEVRAVFRGAAEGQIHAAGRQRAGEASLVRSTASLAAQVGRGAHVRRPPAGHTQLQRSDHAIVFCHTIQYNIRLITQAIQ